jgi:hypothetical protein
MEKSRIITGRLIGPRSVELDEAATGVTAEFEVIVRPAANQPPESTQSLSDFLRSLPPGTRSKEDIDRQIHAERSSWGDN